MKIHFGKTRFPWRLSIKLPSIYTRLHEYQSRQMTLIEQVYGISFGYKRFIGFVITGPIVIEESRAALERSEGSPVHKPAVDSGESGDE
ncbi:hypothetical protein DXT96_06875 [Agrobacterium sp. ICMP 6402]|uniref:hypothetical protein n=1 Tax=Agrobacterium sp. ICMP 6402 TaxID=2292443 RepID=UPI00129782CB|nr:hypothetical protein [Agrobacterium sp. ICMP 6402]MQB09578.1 hypothetical protein [Agrobacterium sp. ICMP 6402]